MDGINWVGPITMPAGRPKIEIDLKQFEALCRIQATRLEMASFFSCSEDTIERWVKRAYHKNFAEVFQQYKEIGKISLRRKSHEVAMSGNVKMLIWLRKQHLGERDKHEVSGPDGNPLEVSITIGNVIAKAGPEHS